jgi:hypothetical protein
MGCTERIMMDGKVVERDCHGKGKPQASDPATGPGTELKAVLKNWLGIEANLGCSCNAMARQMNAMGPDWCAGEGMPKILDAMRGEHRKRSTWLPWSEIGARQLVLLACRRARAKASCAR